MSDWRKEVKKDSRFLYAFDIEDTSPVEVEIVGSERVEAYCPGEGKGTMWCLKFKGAKKMLGVNVTNGNLIEHVIGTADTDKWIGKRIVLRVAQCGPDRCIRVHAPGAKLPKQCKRFEYLDSDPASKPSSKPQPAQPVPSAVPIRLLAGPDSTSADFDKAVDMSGIDHDTVRTTGGQKLLTHIDNEAWQAAIEMVADMMGID